MLSLSEHDLDTIPDAVFHPDLQKKLKTLDLSKNNLKDLGKLSLLKGLKSLRLDENKLSSGSLAPVKDLLNLQNLSLDQNRLGKQIESTEPSKVSRQTKQAPVLPSLPPSLKQLVLSSNFFSSVPSQVLSPSLVKLEKLDLSRNQLATIPAEIFHLVNLQDLALDSNTIVCLPDEVGRLSKLKVVSLRNNLISVQGAGKFSPQNPQPLPSSLFTDTSLIDLNLHGNPMTNTQLNEFDGFQAFLDRRQKVKSKTLSNLDVCGLK